MTAQRAFGGICAAVLTPLNERLEPDAEKAIPYYRKLLESGCTALNVLGTTGEALSIPVAQRLRFMQAVGAQLSAAEMMVGTSAAALSDTIELTRAAHTLGYSGALIMPPRPAASLSEDGIVDYYRAVVEALDPDEPFIYLYNFPRLSGIAFSVDLVDRIMKRFGRAIAGIKDSSNDVAYEVALANAHPQLAIFPSSECHLLSARRFGLAGCISGTVCLWPERAKTIWSSTDDGQAQTLQRELCALRTQVEQHDLIPAVRYLIAQAENDNSWERTLPPLLPLSEAGRDALWDATVHAVR